MLEQSHASIRKSERWLLRDTPCTEAVLEGAMGPLKSLYSTKPGLWTGSEWVKEPSTVRPLRRTRQKNWPAGRADKPQLATTSAFPDPSGPNAFVIRGGSMDIVADWFKITWQQIETGKKRGRRTRTVVYAVLDMLLNGS